MNTSFFLIRVATAIVIVIIIYLAEIWIVGVLEVSGAENLGITVSRHAESRFEVNFA